MESPNQPNKLLKEACVRGAWYCLFENIVILQKQYMDTCSCLQNMSACQDMTEGPSDAVAGKNVQYPICLIVLGMAGSGKTTFVQRLVSHLYGQKNQPYAINLDPACIEVPFPANIGWCLL
jgi:polynucleotide 5'-kinase involved in rRNA processing